MGHSGEEPGVLGPADSHPPRAALLSLCLQHLLGGLVTTHHLHHDDALQSAGTQCPAGKKHGCSMGLWARSKQVLT